MRRIWIFCLMTFLVIGVSLAQNTVLTHDVKGKVVDNYGHRLLVRWFMLKEQNSLR